jgi:hypothetical protein
MIRLKFSRIIRILMMLRMNRIQPCPMAPSPLGPWPLSLRVSPPAAGFGAVARSSRGGVRAQRKKTMGENHTKREVRRRSGGGAEEEPGPRMAVGPAEHRKREGAKRRRLAQVEMSQAAAARRRRGRADPEPLRPTPYPGAAVPASGVQGGAQEQQEQQEQ